MDCGEEPRPGEVGGGSDFGSSWDDPIVCVAGVPLPPQPDLLPKTAYEPLRPDLYLSLWDALKYMEEVSAVGQGSWDCC